MSGLETLRDVAGGALASLEANRRRIDDLNVYPVPDGDTGTNLTLTVRGVVEALENGSDGDQAALARDLTRAALMSARGNSGVILSQIVRGAAEVLSTRRGELIGPALVRDALARASEEAWNSMADPREGTMLTVISEIHGAVAAKVDELELRELPRDVAEAEQDAMLAELMVTAIAAGQEALERTPEQLDVLAEAGVVDAGAYGLLVILAGLVAGLTGQETGDSPVPHQTRSSWYPDGW